MKSRFQWLSSTISSGMQSATQYATLVGNYLTSNTSQSQESKTVALVDGATSVIERGFFREILKAPQTRSIFFQATGANLKFLAKYLAYEVGRNALWAIPYVEESTLLSIGASTIDWAAFLYMVGEGSALLRDNTFYAMSLSKKANEEVLKGNSSYKPCSDSCGAMSKLQAGMASSYYQAAHNVLFSIPRCIPYVGKISIPLMIYLNGRGFVEYQMVGVCTTHRSEYLANAKMFSLGAGIGLEILLMATNYGLASLLGIGNWAINAATGANLSLVTISGVGMLIVDYALFNTLSHYYTIVSHTIKMPVSENKSGKDLLYVTRTGLGASLEAGYESIMANIPFSTEQFDMTAIKEMIKKFFLQTDSAETFLESYEEIIQRAIVEVGMRRVTPGLKEVAYYNQRMSIPISALKNNRQALRVIFDDNTAAIFTFIKNMMIERRLNKADAKLTNYPLTDEDRELISREIEGELARLRKQDEKRIDKTNLHTCLDKLTILDELYVGVSKLGKLTDIRKLIAVWKQNHAVLINAHRNMLIGYWKKTETADFIDELIEFAAMDFEEVEGAEIVRQNEILQRIQERIESQQSLISYYKIDGQKSQSLNELDLLINNENYKNLSFNQIYSVWKEYNWYIIEAHRYISTTLKNAFASYLSDEYEANHTRTVKFLDHLSKQYADSSKPDVVEQLVAPKVTSSSSKPWMPPLAECKAFYADLIDEEIYRLQTDKADKKKITALTQLKQLVNRQEVAFSMSELIDQWKRKGNWKIVNTHRDATTSVFSKLVLNQLTSTAKFIEDLALRLPGSQSRPVI